MLIYDIEIVKAIEGKNDGFRFEGIEYCAGWHDHKNMGVSCICAYDYDQDRYRTFFQDNWNEFILLTLRHNIIIGYNNIGFDNKVLRETGIVGNDFNYDSKSYDILREIWIASGLSPEFQYPSHIGYGLDDVVKANHLAEGKTGHGLLAPVDFQSGKYGKLVDYCLADVWLTKKVMDQIIKTGTLISPVNGNVLNIKFITPTKVSH